MGRHLINSEDSEEWRRILFPVDLIGLDLTTKREMEERGKGSRRTAGCGGGLVDKYLGWVLFAPRGGGEVFDEQGEWGRTGMEGGREGVGEVACGEEWKGLDLVRRILLSSMVRGEGEM